MARRAVGSGSSPYAAASMVSFYALCWTVGVVLWDYLGERIPGRFALAIVHGTGAISALVVLTTTSVVGAVAFPLLYGLIVAGSGTLEALIWADYYGRASVGSIRGFERHLLMGLNSLGPIVAAVAVDRTGSYTAAAFGFAAINGLIALLVLAVRPLTRPSALGRQ